MQTNHKHTNNLIINYQKKVAFLTDTTVIHHKLFRKKTQPFHRSYTKRKENKMKGYYL